MALTHDNLKKWFLMLTGKSVLHVNQDIGRYFKKDTILGYYNNMMEKVDKLPQLLLSANFPTIETKHGPFVFPVGVFQYAFGLLDHYYETSNPQFLDKFQHCVNWAVMNQRDNGAWDNFSFYYPTHPYSAMAQGEGASLLIRAYAMTKEKNLLSSAKRAIDFMIKDVNEGGCTDYGDDSAIFLEYTHRKAVMNGWIFSWWGLYDWVLVSKDEGYYKGVLDKSLQSLVKKLPEFNNSYWSVYDLEGRIASPFYHNLHIAQMQAMFVLTELPIFGEYATKWQKQQHDCFCKSRAFVTKAYQKIFEE